MEITIPTIPVGIVTLLAFFGPFAVAAVNGWLKFVTKAWQKKLVSIVVSVVLAAVVIVFYLGFGGSFAGASWAWVGVVSILVVAFSYSVITKQAAARVEARAGGDA